MEAASEEVLEGRLDDLSRTMKNSAILMERVSAELEVRAVTVQKLKEEAQAAKSLAGIHREQAEAIRRLIDIELEGTTRRIRKDSIRIGIASFVAGSGVTLFVTLLVHPLY